MITEVLAEVKEEQCAILVYGVVPEFMPHLTFRREKHYKTAGTKIIKCPYCGEVFTVVEATAKLELIRYPKKSNTGVKWHKAMPCKTCHNVVGIIYIAA